MVLGSFAQDLSSLSKVRLPNRQKRQLPQGPRPPGAPKAQHSLHQLCLGNLVSFKLCFKFTLLKYNIYYDGSYVITQSHDIVYVLSVLSSKKNVM